MEISSGLYKMIKCRECGASYEGWADVEDMARAVCRNCGFIREVVGHNEQWRALGKEPPPMPDYGRLGKGMGG